MNEKLFSEMAAEAADQRQRGVLQFDGSAAWAELSRAREAEILRLVESAEPASANVAAEVPEQR